MHERLNLGDIKTQVRHLSDLHESTRHSGVFQATRSASRIETSGLSSRVLLFLGIDQVVPEAGKGSLDDFIVEVALLRGGQEVLWTTADRICLRWILVERTFAVRVDGLYQRCYDQLCFQQH
jgi:hypothetical protein